MPNVHKATIFRLDPDNYNLLEVAKEGPRKNGVLEAGESFDLLVRNIWIDNLILGPGQEEVSLQIRLTCDRPDGDDEAVQKEELQLTIVDHVTAQSKSTSYLLGGMGARLVQGAKVPKDGVGIGFRLAGRVDEDAVVVMNKIAELLGEVDDDLMPTLEHSANTLVPNLDLGSLAGGAVTKLVPLLGIVGKGFQLIGSAMEKDSEVIRTYTATFYPKNHPHSHIRMRRGEYVVVQNDRIRDHAHGGNMELEDFLTQEEPIRYEDGELYQKGVLVPFNFFVFDIQ